MLADVCLDLGASHRLVPEGLIQPAQDAAPLLVVAHDLADGVQQVAALGVAIARAVGVHAVGADDRDVVLDPAPGADDIGVARVAAEQALGVEILRVVREALVHPDVGFVFRRDVVAEPFVRALVHDDEIPLEAQPRPGQVGSPIPVGVPVAVRHRALMLHPRVRHLDQLVAVFVPGIRPEPVLEALQHRPGLGELTPGGVHVIVERPEIERQRPALPRQRVAEVRVAAGRHGDRVIIDRIHHEPLVRGRPVGMVGGAAQPPVRDVDQAVRYCERNALAVRLVRLRVLVGPPHARAESLVGRDDPGAAQAVAVPGEAAVPGRQLGGLGLPVIENRDGLGRAGRLRRRELSEAGVAVAPERHRPAVLHHAVDLERDHEVDLQLARGFEHAVRDAVRPPDARVGRTDRDVEVVEGHVPPRACGGRVGAAQRIRVGEHAGLSGEADGGAQQDAGGEGRAFHIVQNLRGALTLRWCAFDPQFGHHSPWCPVHPGLRPGSVDGSRLYVKEGAMTLVKVAPPPPLSQDVDLTRTYDAVIVGSGAAGGMAAHVLTEQGMDVLLLEAGKKFDINQIGQELRSMQWPYDHPRRGDAPPGYHSLSFNEYTVRNPPYAKGSTFKHVMSYVGGWGGSDYVKNILVDEKDHPYTGTKYAWVRARLLGGKTNIWGRLALRLSDYDFKAKAHDGYGEDWPISYADIAPYYDKVDLLLGIAGHKENLRHLPDSLFQRSTKLNVAEVGLRHTLARMGRVLTPYRAGVTTDGVKNKYRSRCMGRGACDRRGGCDIHAAFDSPTGLIYPAMDTGNLTLRSNSTCHEVLVDRATGKARGVAFVDSVTKRSLEAKGKVVILAASTLESARLMLLSKSPRYPNGIGNSSGHVGHNFCEHEVVT